jgi:hypothetical protein
MGSALSYLNYLSKVQLRTTEVAPALDAIFDIGQTILASRVIDEISGSRTSIAYREAEVLDRAWIFFALQSFFSKNLPWIMSTPLPSGKYSTPVPAAPELIPAWNREAFFGDDVLKSVARNQNTDTSKVIRSLTRMSPIAQPITFRRRIRAPLKSTLDKLHSFADSTLPTTTLITDPYNLIYRLAPLEMIALRRRGVSIQLSARWNIQPADSVNHGMRQILLLAIRDIATNELIRLGYNSGVADRLSLYLTAAAPTTHIENRRKNWAIAQKATNRNLKKVFSATGLYYSGSSQFTMATARSRGAELIGVQHGGYYGYSANHMYVHSVELQANDRFISWGFQDYLKITHRPITTKITPSGSTYLRQIRKSTAGNDLSIGSRILFAPNSPTNRPCRLDGITSADEFEAYVWPYENDLIAKWCARFDLKLATKWYIHFPNSMRTQDLKRKCEESSVEFKEINTHSPAVRLLRDYDFALWDSIGTGFFESIAAGKPTFLTPGARVTPVLAEGLSVSDLFFIDHESLHSNLHERFQCALEESQDFLDTYGKVSTTSFSELILQIT